MKSLFSMWQELIQLASPLPHDLQNEKFNLKAEIYGEIDQAIPNLETLDNLIEEDISDQKFPKLVALLEETLRMYTPAYSLFYRQGQKDDGGRCLSEERRIDSNYLINRHEQSRDIRESFRIRLIPMARQ